MTPGRAPDRPELARACCETQLALRQSMPAQAGMEPRPSFPSGNRAPYTPTEGHACP